MKMVEQDLAPYRNGILE